MEEEILLWMGCVYRNRLKELREEIEGLLKRLKIRFKTLENEECCGYPLFLMGYEDEAAKFAEKNSRILGDEKLVVTPCPGCFRSFNAFYPDLLKRKTGFKVQHITQFYSDLIDKGIFESEKLREVKKKVMYHDPCELGRHSKIFEEPRRVLRMIPGLSLYEQRLTQNLSACCGGGGLVSAYFPTLSSMAAARKLFEEDQIPKDLEAVVTECPQCIINLRQAWLEEETKSIEVYNFAKLLNIALG
jgi:Fe-S oxidoreductase